MTDAPSIRGRRVLVAEDEYMIAEDLRDGLEDAGLVVLGPAPSVGKALALLESEPAIDGAVLDLNLGGEMIFPVADALVRRGVPFVFTTGYDKGAVPERFEHIPCCEKPVETAALVRVLSGEMSA